MTALKRFVQDCVIIYAEKTGNDATSTLDSVVENIFQLLHSNYIASISQLKECTPKDLEKLTIPVDLATILIAEAKKGPSKSTSNPVSAEGQRLVSAVVPAPTEFYFELKKPRFQHQYYESEAISNLVKDYNKKKLLVEVAMIITRILSLLIVIGFVVSFISFGFAFGFGYENLIIISFAAGGGYRFNTQDDINAKVTVSMLAVGIIIFLIMFVEMVISMVIINALEYLYRNVVFAIMKKHRKNVKEVAIKVNISGDRYLCVSC